LKKTGANGKGPQGKKKKSPQDIKEKKMTRKQKPKPTTAKKPIRRKTTSAIPRRGRQISKPHKGEENQHVRKKKRKVCSFTSEALRTREFRPAIPGQKQDFLRRGSGRQRREESNP